MSEEITLGNDEQYVNFITQCWKAEASFRPAASDIVSKLKEIAATETEFNRNLVEHKQISELDKSRMCTAH